MFPLFLKNLLFLPSRKVFTGFQGLSSASFPEVSVWWHLDSCPVPSGVSFSKVAPSIMAAVRANGIMGTIHIRAYGDFNSSGVDKEALKSTNISLYSSIVDDYPSYIEKIVTVEKYNTYKHFLMDLNDWVSTNPPPLHLFLIFGNRDFSSSGILHRLRMCNYNILLACPGRAHVAALCHAATIMWEWSSMLKGEDLIGKHFNYPPDGPTNSWYENSNVPLENPFSAVELHTSSQNAAEIYKPTSDIKLSQASKSFSRQVMKILCSHPNGISIGDLRAELTKCDLPLVKRFYGNKKFSNFLVSISHVQLQYLGGDNFWVCLVPSTKSAVKNKQSDGAATQKLHNEGKNLDRSADGIPRISSSCVSSDGEITSVDVNPEILEKKNPSQNLSTCNDCTMFKSKHEIPARKEVDEVCRSPFTSTFYSWISSWWTFWKGSFYGTFQLWNVWVHSKILTNKIQFNCHIS